MNSLSVLGIVCSISVATSFLLATYFYFVRKKDKYAYKLLSFLFIAIGLRISKSILFFIFHLMTPESLSLGYFSLASIGPLLYLYMRFFNGDNVLNEKKDFVHIIVPIVGTFVCFFSSLETVTILYKATTALLFIYVCMSFVLHRKNVYKNEDLRIWNVKIIFTILIVWGAFIYQHLTESILDYAIGAGLSSLPLYYLFINALKFPVIFRVTKNEKLPKEIANKIKRSFEEDKIYLKSRISLAEYSAAYSIPTYLVTRAIKDLYKKSFPELINHFRIEEVKLKLQDDDYYNEKIERIAFEVGFNSPSVFFTVFKRNTGMSPKQFKEKFHI